MNRHVAGELRENLLEEHEDALRRKEGEVKAEDVLGVPRDVAHATVADKDLAHNAVLVLEAHLVEPAHERHEDRDVDE
eukprot:CAMPEP_0195601714 /NCGR_PEP_ID=MMETSP0815-20121206/5228_1 /TAXON_ID=97485 /ORGANISM="Prymnesium parvum, Strain Texoma1" /LENGTH=77 /DNA_ID=CAMNT_0040741265 /DNA_START=807 /DNA_END=1037 /DNA_ORIENTATION=+